MISSGKRVFLLAGFIVLATVSNTGLQIWSDYQENRRRMETMTHDIVRVVDAQVHDSVRQASAMLDLLADQIRHDKGLDFIGEPARWKRLRAYCNGLPGCRSIAVLNPEGQVAAWSDKPGAPKFSAADRTYFQMAKKTGRLFVGPAIVGRIAGNPIIFSIAQPVMDGAGKLLAVVVAGMDTAHWTEFYGLLGFGINPTVTIFKRNGDIVARYPGMARCVGKNFTQGALFARQLAQSPEGMFLSVSTLDGKRRIASYKTDKDLDLVIFAGIDTDTAFHRWKVESWRNGISDAILLFVILLALYWSYRSRGREKLLKVKNIELDRLSHCDALTGLANRRFFDASLERIWASQVAEGTSLSLLMIDVDCFKSYNDHYGHQAGDDCLRRVAAAIRSALHRNGDIAARYGGEEFAVILEAHARAAIIGERVRSHVEALAMPHAFSDAGPVVTVSVGVASLVPGDDDSPMELIEAADEALYQAKRRGRNQMNMAAAVSDGAGTG